MARYHVRFVHKISPKDTDTASVQLGKDSLASCRALAAALRWAGIMSKGQRIKSMRAEGEKIIVFPTPSVWHSIILTPEA